MLRVREQFPGSISDSLIFKNFWVSSTQLPYMEKWRPIDKRNQFAERNILQDPNSRKRRAWGPAVRRPIDLKFAASRFFQSKKRDINLPFQMFLTCLRLPALDLVRKRRHRCGIHQMSDDADSPGCIGDVHNGVIIGGGDLHRGVNGAGCSATDK